MRPDKKCVGDRVYETGPSVLGTGCIRPDKKCVGGQGV